MQEAVGILHRARKEVRLGPAPNRAPQTRASNVLHVDGEEPGVGGAKAAYAWQ